MKTFNFYCHFIAIVLFMLTASLSLFSQNVDSLLKKAEYYRHKNPDSSVFIARKALSLIDTIFNKELSARVHYTLGYAYYNRNDFELALYHFKHAITLVSNNSNPNLLALIHNRIGNVYQLKSYYNQAIDEYKKALELNYKSGNRIEIARTLVNIGTVFSITGNFSIALQYMLDALQIFEQAYEPEGMAWTSLSISRLFSRLEINEKAMQYAENALNLYRKLNNQTGITLSQTELANIYYHTGMHDKALDLLTNILQANKKNQNLFGEAANFLLMGIIYFDNKQLDLSEKYLNLSLQIKQQVNDSIDVSKLNRYLGELEIEKGNIQTGLIYLNRALIDAQQQKITTDLRDTYFSLSRVEQLKGDYRKAFDYYTQYSALKDSVNASQIAKLEMQYDFEKREREQELINRQREAMQQAKLERQRMVTIFISVALILSLALAGVVFWFYREKKTINQILVRQNREIIRQKDEIENQKHEIEAQRDLAERQRDQIAEQQKQITDSIQYASRIQAAVLPREQQVASLLKEHFVLYQPKNIVSGDFYWVTRLPNGRIAIAVADCTGHGVPGAFMSMLGITLLKELTAAQTFTNPADLLIQLRRMVISSLNQTDLDNDSHDGIDMGLLVIDKEKNLAEYAGAYFPLLIIRNSGLPVPNGARKREANDKAILYEIKGDKMPIGHHVIEERPFSTYHFPIFDTDTFYLLSDGYTDQFGGKDNHKFMMINLMQLLLNIYQLPMSVQNEKLRNEFEAFRGDQRQVDDILVMGFRV